LIGTNLTLDGALLMNSHAVCSRLAVRAASYAAMLAGGVVSSAALALDTRVVTNGLNNPLFLTAPSGDSRLFIVERGGSIRIFENGTLLPDPFLTVPNVATSGERGLLGLAFDPNYANSGSPGFGKFYVNYIDSSRGNNTFIESFQVSSDRNRADPASRRAILEVTQPPPSNHKAGWIGFRRNEPDNLYIATGDGGSGDDPDNNAQNKGSNLGKILRVDVHNVSSGQNYSIPAGNPFAGDTIPGNDEIWAYGLRNPYRNSFDRESGAFYIADVGQGALEEINVEMAGTPGGRNYGWRPREGNADNPSVPEDLAPGLRVDPIYAYAHGDGPFQGDSVTGGYVYRGSLIDGLQGTYIFGDYMSGRIFSLQVDPTTGLMIPGSEKDLTEALGDPFGGPGLASFGEDGFGELYLVNLGAGTILQVVPEPATYALMGAGLMLMLWLGRRRAQCR
jgi:glucose/arabinose dehydrogenase